MTLEKPLDGKIVLVTGASRGIGHAAALELGRRGAHVVAVARTVGGLEELDDAIQATGGTTTLVPLDLREHDAIDRLGQSIFERWGRLDGLLANAAMVGTITPVGHMRPKDFDQILSLNYVANYRLIRSLDLPLREAEAGRVVFMTTDVAARAPAYWGAYAASKSALETIAAAYAAEMQSSRVRVNAFDPGPLRTRLRAAGWPGENPEVHRPPETVAPAIADMLAPAFADNGMLVSFATGAKTALRGSAQEVQAPRLQ